jgi:hypothetical protein
MGDLRLRRQAIIDDLTARAEKALPCTVPIYQRDEHGRFELFGSGVLLRHGSQYFVLSAAHVLARPGAQGLWIGDGAREGPLVRLAGAYHIGGSADASDTTRSIDVGFAPLSSADVATLYAPRFLSVCDIEPAAAAAPDAHYYAVGYAVRDYTRVGSEQLGRIKKFTALEAMPASAGKYLDRGVSERSHLVLTFGREQTEDADGVAATPKLNGMSGCGVWRRRAKSDAERLTAIFIEHHEGARKYIVATRLEILLAGLAGYVAGELAPDDSEHRLA